MIEAEGRAMAKSTWTQDRQARKNTVAPAKAGAIFSLPENGESMKQANRAYRQRSSLEFQSQARERTRSALLRQEEEFARLHGNDPEEPLLDYVRQWSIELGRTPHAGEITGGTYLAARFQGWDRVLASAGLPPPPAMPSLEDRLIYKKEYKRQERLLRQEKNAAREADREQRARSDAQGRAEDLARQERDFAWGREHDRDSDARLIAYVRDCAGRLGHSPTAQEVLGAAYIAQRFGSWAVALTAAELPLPRGVKPPNPKTLRAYRERENAGGEHQEIPAVHGAPWSDAAETLNSNKGEL